MGVSGGDVHHLESVPAHGVLEDLLAVHAAEADEGLPRDHEELLVLGVVPVVPLGDARLGHVHRDLPPVRGAEEFGEGPPVV